jgi:uncharacterized protein YbjT (DUF2867 family)
VIPVDYSNKQSIKSALAGIDVVISTISGTALGVQPAIAEAAKEAGVKLFIPSEFGGPTEGATEGLFGAKAGVQDQLKAVGMPYALMYTGPFSDFLWQPYAASSSQVFFFFSLVLNLAVMQVHRSRRQKWESIRRGRWQQADLIHVQT